MRNAEPVGDPLGVIDILTGAAGTLFLDRFAMVIELQGDTDDVITGFGHQRRCYRAVDATGHGNNDTGVLGRFRRIDLHLGV